MARPEDCELIERVGEAKCDDGLDDEAHVGGGKDWMGVMEVS